MTNTGFTAVLNEFDCYLTNNYKKLRYGAQQTFWNDSEFEDHLQDNILKFRERIAKSGFTGNNYNGYLGLSNLNAFRRKKNVDKRSTYIDYTLPSLENELQSVLEDNQYNSQQYLNDVNVLVRCMFKYLDTYYDGKYATLFKTYHLTDNNTYLKLANESKLSYGRIKNVISSMRKDLQQNLIKYTIYECSEEVYRPILNYPKYLISTKGRVKNVHGKQIKPDYEGGYGLWRNNKRKYKSITQLQEGVFRKEDCLTFKRIII